MTIMVYKVMAGAFLKHVDKTEKGALGWAASDLKVMWGDIDYEITSERMDLPEVTGSVLVDEDTKHVTWLCPYCEEWHFTDLEPDEEAPALWFCESKDNENYLCLVHFKR